MEAPKTIALKEFANQAVFQQFVDQQHEPDWMQEFRRQAFACYEKQSWPTLQDEEWRRTNIAHIPLGEYTVTNTPAGSQKPIAALEEGVTAGGQITFAGRSCTRLFLDNSLAQQGIIFTTLAAAILQYPDLVQRYFLAHKLAAQGKFESLNAAFWSHGIFLYLPKGVEVVQPLAVSFQEEGGHSTSFPYVLAIAENGSRATLFQTITSGQQEGTFLCNSCVNLQVQDGAGLNYILLQTLNPHTVYFANGWSSLGRDSRFTSLTANLGSSLSKSRFECMLEGTGAEVGLKGFYLAGGSQHFDLKTIQHHKVPAGKSNILYKGVLSGQARTVYQGMINVFPQAQKTDAYQANRNLLLSDAARADSIPGLEIRANDLKCTHGSTTSRVNELDMFYLMARGLPRAEAQKMIVAGFLEDVIAGLPDSIEATCRQAIEERL